MKQSVVEWQHAELMRINFEYATNKITPRDFQEQTKKNLEQAKEMEKQQIIDFAVWFNNRDNTYKSYTQIVERYYNETFKNK